MVAAIPHDEVRYASLGRRLAALVTDFMILSFVFFPVTRIVKGVWIMSPGDHDWTYSWLVTDPLCLIFLVIIFIYFVTLEGIYGATTGKWLLGIKVITGDGAVPGLWKSFLRNIFRVVDALPAFNLLGVILIIRSPERTRLGDRVSQSRVVHARPVSQKLCLAGNLFNYFRKHRSLS